MSTTPPVSDDEEEVTFAGFAGILEFGEMFAGYPEDRSDFGGMADGEPEPEPEPGFEGPDQEGAEMEPATALSDATPGPGFRPPPGWGGGVRPHPPGRLTRLRARKRPACGGQA